MSQRLISHSPDLKRLRDEGYTVRIDQGHLVVHDIPYVTAERTVARAALVDPINLAVDRAQAPGNHTIFFTGTTPCDPEGRPLNQIINQVQTRQLAHGITATHSFSSKPVRTGRYDDYYDKITTYARILAGPAASIDANASPAVFQPVVDVDDDSPFVYLDTASSRAGIEALNSRFEDQRAAIVGLGGTGSYILDLLAKTPVPEIHLYDADRFEQHCAFRAPGAATLDELKLLSTKARHWASRYEPLRGGVVAHECYIDESNVDELHDMTVVFLAMDSGPEQHTIVASLDEAGITWIDVGLGLDVRDDALGGMARTSASTPDYRAASSRLPAGAGSNEYDANIQVADLNALNAALAVIRWKKLIGYYADLEHEHHSLYVIDGNEMVNEERL